MGKYHRIYINNENEDVAKELAEKQALGTTINSLLSMSTSGATVQAMSTGKNFARGADAPKELTCKNGHLLVGDTGKCMAKGCKFGK